MANVNRAKQHANNKDFWETPPDVFEDISKAFGGFDLDVAASDENHLCDRYYTEQTNALVQPWDTKTFWWCNPPFSLKEQFLNKATVELACGNPGVMLLPSSQEAEWFRKYIAHPRIPRITWPGRIQFLIGGKRLKRLDEKTGKMVTSGNVGGSVIVAFTNHHPNMLPPLAGEPWVR